MFDEAKGRWSSVQPTQGTESDFSSYKRRKNKEEKDVEKETAAAAAVALSKS